MSFISFIEYFKRLYKINVKIKEVKKMKKILLLFLLFLGGVLFYVHKCSIEKKVDDYIIIETGFINNPRLYCKEHPKIKLIDKKTNQEIKNYNYFIKGLYIVNEGDYRIEAFYNNEVTVRDIKKQADKGLKYDFFLEQSAEMKSLDNFTRLFGLESLIFNLFLFFKLFRKKENKRLLLIFCHLILIHFLSFINIFTGYQLVIIQMIVEISLFSFLISYFLSYIKKKNKKLSNCILIISIIMLVFISSMLMFVASENILVYFVKYHSDLFNTLVIINYIINIILNLSNYIIPYAILIRIFINTQDKDYRKMKGYQLLFLTLVFLISILMVTILESSFRLYPRYDVLFLLGATVLFWILFFGANMEAALEIHRKHRYLYSYILKVLSIFVFIYIYIISSKSYHKMIPVLLIYIFGEGVYYFCKVINYNRNIDSYNKFFNKLRGTDNIEEFQRITESEILKKNSLESIKFKILSDYNEEKEYVKIIDNNKIIKNEYLQDNFKKYDFGLRMKVKGDVCIALLLVKTKNGKYLNEFMTSLSIFMDDLVYIVNYIRTLNIKSSLEKKNEKEEVSKILEEHLIFIREFSLLIKKKSKEENIKTYSEIILKNVKDLGDKFE